jgi:uncharacterized protein (UPF0147 family)
LLPRLHFIFMNRNLVLGNHYFSKVDSTDLNVLVYALDSIIKDRATPANFQSTATVLKEYIQALLDHRKTSDDTY